MGSKPGYLLKYFLLYPQLNSRQTNEKIASICFHFLFVFVRIEDTIDCFRDFLSFKSILPAFDPSIYRFSTQPTRTLNSRKFTDTIAHVLKTCFEKHPDRLPSKKSFGNLYLFIFGTMVRFKKSFSVGNLVIRSSWFHISFNIWLYESIKLKEAYFKQHKSTFLQ